MLYNGIWGTVCDDSWDFNDAMVVCRQLGLPTVGAQALTGSDPFGEGSGQIWLDNVECTGSEDRLEDCHHNGWGSHNCRHREDAGVRCVDGMCQQYYMYINLDQLVF